MSRYGGEESSIQGFGGGKPRERDHLKDPDLGGRIILNWILKKWEGGTNWNDLTQDKDR